LFESSVLRRIFGAKRERRRLQNEQLHDLYSSPNIVQVIRSRRINWAGHVARMGDGRGAYWALVEKREWKRPLGKPSRRWETY
jgi:hypothetical protein